MNSLKFFTHTDPECSGSSLSARREGEEGESDYNFTNPNLQPVKELQYNNFGNFRWKIDGKRCRIADTRYWILDTGFKNGEGGRLIEIGGKGKRFIVIG